MKPIYLDLHIHTSEDEENLNINYDIDTLLNKIKDTSQGADFLISLTDHNTINKDAYLKLKEKTENIIIGVELHIINSPEKQPYHCHFYFDIPVITEEEIDNLNSILNELYPDKKVSPPYKMVKNLEAVIQAFDKYDFLVLPHGGQSHSVFHESIEGQLDTKLTKSIYYNFFDGFTARNKTGLERTNEYFKKLGISEYVNLITSTDNYSPSIYPNPKSGRQASPFLPTWMLAEPTFDGLRISLSESSRLIYSNTQPTTWAEYIRKVEVNNTYLDIDAPLSSELNVVIGDSSSGKTLFVDTIYRKSINNFEGSKYLDLNVEQISVSNPAGNIPHYIDQNFITNLISFREDQIENIDIIKKVFPDDESTKNQLDRALSTLKNDIDEFIASVEKIEDAQKEILSVPALGSLIKKNKVKKNMLQNLVPNESLITKMDYQDHKYTQHLENLNEIKSFMQQNVFAEYVENDFTTIEEKLENIYNKSKKESSVRRIINNAKSNINTVFATIDRESETKRSNFERLISNVKLYKTAQEQFKTLLEKIQSYAISVETREIESIGHKLFIEYIFKLSAEIFLLEVNKLLKTNSKIRSIDDLIPEKLFKKHFKDNPPIDSYEDFTRKLYSNFIQTNKKKYKIITKDGRSFNDLSAGWKTSVLLDLILGYDGDDAPLIIDQPEDNLANNYINNGLIKAIKNAKIKKQIIIVSHNATIPMLADAKNIVICENKNNKIYIRSAALESKHDSRKIVDHIASITDGGKSSIRKRFKKYNMKNFEE